VQSPSHEAWSEKTCLLCIHDFSLHALSTIGETLHDKSTLQWALQTLKDVAEGKAPTDYLRVISGTIRPSPKQRVSALKWVRHSIASVAIQPLSSAMVEAARAAQEAAYVAVIERYRRQRSAFSIVEFEAAEAAAEAAKAAEKRWQEARLLQHTERDGIRSSP